MNSECWSWMIWMIMDCSSNIRNKSLECESSRKTIVIRIKKEQKPNIRGWVAFTIINIFWKHQKRRRTSLISCEVWWGRPQKSFLLFWSSSEWWFEPVPHNEWEKEQTLTLEKTSRDVLQSEETKVKLFGLFIDDLSKAPWRKRAYTKTQWRYYYSTGLLRYFWFWRKTTDEIMSLPKHFEAKSVRKFHLRSRKKRPKKNPI